MSVSISKITDSNGDELKAGDSNAGATPPFTVHGTATANHTIILWLNKEMVSMMPTSTNDGKWTYVFTPMSTSKEIDLVAAEVGYFNSTNGTFNRKYSGTQVG
jgi:hypothetical protein